MWVGIVIVIIVLIAGVYVKVSVDEKKGIDSEEKKKIQEIVRGIVPAGEEYTAVYAYKELKTAHHTTCWPYAIGFNQERIYVIPLSITKEEISYSDFFMIEKEELGVVNSIGNTEILTWAAFYDENRKELLSIWVRESNTKDSKAYPVNIQQKEEMREFAKLINRWMEEVNTAHGVVASKKMTGSPVK